MVNIVYQDNLLLVCEKPAGVDSEHELPQLLKEQLNCPAVFCAHRLDRDVGGLMVCALNGKTTAEMTVQFAGHEVTKEYLAVVEGVPKEREGELIDLLFHDARKNKTYVVDRARKGVKEARLRYQVVETCGDADSLIRIRLETGRSHQIRVQFASRKMPLLGDGRYGSKRKECGIALWSHHLAFLHPGTKEQMEFTSVPPVTAPWTQYSVQNEVKE